MVSALEEHLNYRVYLLAFNPFDNSINVTFKFQILIGMFYVISIPDSDVKHEFLRCQNCATEIEVPSAQVQIECI